MASVRASSFAKGTANKSGTDIDLFISLRHDARETLGEIHASLFTASAGCLGDFAMAGQTA